MPAALMASPCAPHLSKVLMLVGGLRVLWGKSGEVLGGCLWGVLSVENEIPEIGESFVYGTPYGSGGVFGFFTFFWC